MIHTRLQRAAVLVLALALAGCSEEGLPEPANSSEAEWVSQDKIDASLIAAERYFDNGEIDKAEAILATLLKRQPDQPRAHELMATMRIARADACTKRGDDDGAIQAFVEAYGHYQKTLALSHANPGLEQSAGKVALAANRADAALAHFQRAGALDPTDPSIALLEASVLLQMDRVREARAAIDRALALNGDEPYALATLAMIQKEQGQAEEAIETIGMARDAARPGDELQIRVMEARLHRRLGAPERALVLLLPLSDAQRGERAVAWEIAESSAAMGNHPQAIDAWAHCYRVTEDWRAALAAAEHAFTAGQTDEAWRWFRRAELAAPSAATVREFYAKLREAARAGQSSGDSAEGD